MVQNLVCYSVLHSALTMDRWLEAHLVCSLGQWTVTRSVASLVGCLEHHLDRMKGHTLEMCLAMHLVQRTDWLLDRHSEIDLDYYLATYSGCCWVIHSEWPLDRMMAEYLDLYLEVTMVYVMAKTSVFHLVGCWVQRWETNSVHVSDQSMVERLVTSSAPNLDCCLVVH